MILMQLVFMKIVSIMFENTKFIISLCIITFSLKNVIILCGKIFDSTSILRMLCKTYCLLASVTRFLQNIEIPSNQLAQVFQLAYGHALNYQQITHKYAHHRGIIVLIF